MQIDPSLRSNEDNYKVLTNIVVPRPIAWVTSLNQSGLINLAPFSFFNAVGTDPIYIIISIGHNESGKIKDTANNISTNGEFVVNMVTEDLLEEMNISAADFPADQSEVEATNLDVKASIKINTPRIAKAQASMECKLFSEQLLGANKLFISEVVMFHVADNLIDQNLHINSFSPVGRLGSPSVYCHTVDRFELNRITYAEWLSSHGG